uniref:MD-2-related lipid-recognition domain-containing protein n=1 Tax=Heliothis virescens TaxID=7102 RepID=A0A2A4J285_HELVI
MSSSCRSSALAVPREVMQYLLYIIIFSSLIIKVIGQTDTKNYGPYEVVWEKFETCKGPKQSECGLFEIKNSENMSDIVFHLDFPKDCPASSAKIITSTITNNVTKKLWNYALNKPCEHFVLGPILVDAFNLTKNCKVNKGRYEVHLDFEAKSKMFLGTSFFYGEYGFKTMSFNKVNNFFCVYAVLNIKKRD